VIKMNVDELNKKVNSVIEWLLNDLPLINQDIKDKLLVRFPLMSYTETKSVSDKEFLKIEMDDYE